MATEATTRLEENKRLACRVPEEVASKGDLDLIDELYTENAVEHTPTGDEQGRTAIRAACEAYLDAFPDLSATVEEVIAEGELVTMRVTLRGTHEGQLMGIEPTGESFEAQNMVFTRVEDGKIAERWVQPDTLGMLQQLGVVESPE